MKLDKAVVGSKDKQQAEQQPGSHPSHQPPKGNEASNIGVDNEGKIRKEDRWNTTDQKQGKHTPDAKDAGTLNKRRTTMEEPEIDTPALSPDEPPRMETNKSTKR